jgi:hypothetical protein
VHEWVLSVPPAQHIGTSPKRGDNCSDVAGHRARARLPPLVVVTADRDVEVAILAAEQRQASWPIRALSGTYPLLLTVVQ